MTISDDSERFRFFCWGGVVSRFRFEKLVLGGYGGRSELKTVRIKIETKAHGVVRSCWLVHSLHYTLYSDATPL